MMEGARREPRGRKERGERVQGPLHGGVWPPRKLAWTGIGGGLCCLVLFVPRRVLSASLIDVCRYLATTLIPYSTCLRCPFAAASSRSLLAA